MKVPPSRVGSARRPDPPGMAPTRPGRVLPPRCKALEASLLPARMLSGPIETLFKPYQNIIKNHIQILLNPTNNLTEQLY